MHPSWAIHLLVFQELKQGNNQKCNLLSSCCQLFVWAWPGHHGKSQRFENNNPLRWPLLVAPGLPHCCLPTLWMDLFLPIWVWNGKNVSWALNFKLHLQAQSLCKPGKERSWAKRNQLGSSSGSHSPCFLSSTSLLVPQAVMGKGEASQPLVCIPFHPWVQGKWRELGTGLAGLSWESTVFLQAGQTWGSSFLLCPYNHFKEFSTNSANGTVCLDFFLSATQLPADLEPEEAFQPSVSGRLEDVVSWTRLTAWR